MAHSKIKFEMTRPFGDVIGDSIKFTFGNFGPIFIGFLMYVGPFLVLAIISGVSIFDFSMMIADEPELTPYLGKIALFSVSSIFVALIIYGYSYAIIQKYRDDPEGPLMDKFFPYMRDITLRLLLLFMLYMLAIVMLGAAVFLLMSILPIAINVILGFVLFLGFMYVIVPLLMTPYVYINEEVNIAEAVSRSFFLVKDHWWATFGVYFIVSLIASTVSSIVLYPAYIMDIMNMITEADNGDMTGFEMSFFLKASFAASMVISFFFTIMQVVALVLQYFKLREIKEGSSLLDRIESIKVDE